MAMWTAAEFWNLLPIGRISVELTEAMEVSRTGGGGVLASAHGARLWSGRVTLGKLTWAEREAVEALIDRARQPGRTFAAWDLRRPGPMIDPTGALLAGSAPVIASLPSGGVTLGLSGLPPGYHLARGDYIGWSYAGLYAAVRALHRIVTGGTADGAGGLAAIEVVPPIRPGTTTGTAVVLTQVPMEALIVPGSVEADTSRRGISEGTAFSFIQQLER